jgi:glycine/D-amino acid oxidase-like deaminating enzyme/nitrite reductase/ring-hydroxylating ferredoxin subunit
MKRAEEGGRERGGPLWIARCRRPAHAALEHDIEVDVAVIGGGIVGATTAMLLAAEGRSVALLEALQVGHGNTGLSTAKASVFHGSNLSTLVDELGAEDARLVVDGERAALDVMRHWAGELGVEEAVQPVRHWAWAARDEGREVLEQQAEAAHELGLDLRWAGDGDCPFGTHALGIDDQLNLDPVVLLDAFADRVRDLGSHVHEGSRVADVDLGDRCELRLAGGPTVRARDVVVATQVPILDRSLVFAGGSYSRSHVVALEYPGAAERAPDMYTGVDSDGLSLRSATDVDGTPLLVVAGRGHSLDVDEDGSHVDQLAAAARELVPDAGALRRAWLAHDVFPADGRPWVGPIHRHDNVYVASGFAGWGLAAGVSAALAITGLIVRGHARWHEPTDATRLGSYVRLDTLKEGAITVKNQIADRLRAGSEDDVAALRPGEGTVIRSDGRTIAVARDEHGRLRGVDAHCTHQRCLVRHEPEQACWQCPCHGSRFDLDGRILQGPAMKPLAGIDVSQLDSRGARRRVT